MSKTDEFKKNHPPKLTEDNIDEEETEEEKDKKIEDEEKLEEEAKEDKPKKQKGPEKLTMKEAVTIDKPKKNSWTAYEAPDKNGKKIKVYQGKALIMKEKLLAQDEIITFIPHEPGEDKKVPCIVNLNGYKLNIPKNTYVSLPRQVHEVIRQAHQQIQLAYQNMENRFGINRDDQSTEALN